MPKLCSDSVYGSCGRNDDYQCHRSMTTQSNLHGYCCKISSTVLLGFFLFKYFFV